MSDKLAGLALARACADQILSDDSTSQHLGMKIQIIEPGVGREPGRQDGHTAMAYAT